MQDCAMLIIYVEALAKALTQWRSEERAQEAAALDEAVAGDDLAGPAGEPYYRGSPLVKAFAGAIMSATHMPEHGLTKSIWTDADFDTMGWHDARLYCFTVFPESLELVMDLDYITKWVAAVLPEEDYRFGVSPATLIFRDVENFSVTIEDDLSWELQILDVERTALSNGRLGSHWQFELNWGELSLDASGYTQYFRREPVFADEQHLKLDERGGISYARTTFDGVRCGFSAVAEGKPRTAEAGWTYPRRFAMAAARGGPVNARIRDADWIRYIDAEVRAVCEEKGWGHQIRRKWSVRAKPVRKPGVDDYEWKLLPDGVDGPHEIEPRAFDDGRYWS